MGYLLFISGLDDKKYHDVGENQKRIKKIDNDDPIKIIEKLVADAKHISHQKQEGKYDGLAFCALIANHAYH
jgi:hypothetical protein